MTKALKSAHVYMCRMSQCVQTERPCSRIDVRDPNASPRFTGFASFFFVIVIIQYLRTSKKQETPLRTNNVWYIMCDADERRGIKNTQPSSVHEILCRLLASPSTLADAIVAAAAAAVCRPAA